MQQTLHRVKLRQDHKTRKEQRPLSSYKYIQNQLLWNQSEVEVVILYCWVENRTFVRCTLTRNCIIPLFILAVFQSLYILSLCCQSVGMSSMEKENLYQSLTVINKSNSPWIVGHLGWQNLPCRQHRTGSRNSVDVMYFILSKWFWLTTAGHCTDGF